MDDENINGSHKATEVNQNQNTSVLRLIAIELGLQVIPNLAMRYFFKDTLQLEPDQLSTYDALTTAVWILKPLFGFISDSFPL